MTQRAVVRGHGRGRRRGAALAVLGMAALGLHLHLIDALRVAATSGGRPISAAGAGDAAMLTTRLVDVSRDGPARVHIEAAAPMPDRLVADGAVERPAARVDPSRPAPVRSPRPAPRPARPPLPVGNAVAALAPAAAASQVVDPVEAPASPSAPNPAANDEGRPLPLYATRPPPPVTLRYAARRGADEGSAELHWRLDDGLARPARYELRFESRIGAAVAVRQTSTGQLDATGLGPVRHTDARGRRAPLAVNFQREAGKVGFSGSAAELPLEAGLQDGVSWMLQLAAVVAADTARRTVAGATVVLGVVGPRAGRETWGLRCVGRETVDTPAGPIAADRYVRDSGGAHAARVEVWLDPQRHHLPVQARWQHGADGTVTELRLEAIDWAGER